LTTDIDWLADLRCRADRAPNPPREALCIEGQVCGAVEPGLARRMQAAGLPLRQADDGQWAVNSPADESLHAMAHWLSRQGHGGRWRDELLAVTNDAGDAIARVERAAVRALGITTLAVHLVGTTASGMVWVQRRALDKAVDPGMLDTLVGGLVAAGEGIEPSLERETWEEAGLRLQQLRALTPLGRTLVRRPVSDGYMAERLEMYEAEVPDQHLPRNQDGEVMEFDCLNPADLITRLRTGQFTLEASLIHAHWLKQHGHI